ncbi:helix-turn-helix transcriptional regulator [Thermosyntropha sp.]|uniref:helix-turn-helix domain-containing protein n=1 Tax=Thermosyntropha sp. TaxID=2740820 RepID=UPI0025EB9F2A|nr:helix-turn-helix transcriptional regulator [Thermosyntropha sp.]MBO8158131.1 helix-turn-helix transcriptional regulator [Thermosyntropha sp.]
MLGERLRQLRKENDLTRENLAQMLDVTPSIITFYENGARSPSLKVLLSLADYFEVSLDYLTGRSNNPKINQPEAITEAEKNLHQITTQLSEESLNELLQYANYLRIKQVLKP